MRLSIALACGALVATSVARAHGPQLQTTAVAGKIVTRELIQDGPYSNSLTDPKTVYVMPLAEFLGMWQSHPNDARLPDNSFEFPSGPGLAYGYGYDATTNSAPFPVGSKFVLSFTAGLKSWNGAAYVDPGVSELNAYRGSSAAPSAQATTADVGPFQSVMFPAGAGISFATDKAETHNSVSFRMLGDGASSTSAVADGLYLVSFQLSNTSPSMTASDPFYFLLSKNSMSSAPAAIAALGVNSNLVQWVVPEPGSLALAVGGLVGLMLERRRRTAKPRNEVA